MSSVLVVDDEPPILRTMGVNLQARGYKVLLATGGHQALALAARYHPDAVVLDLGLPDMDGLEVIRGLRGWTTIPIVVLSARAGEPEKVAALDAGANDYVTKPFGMDELMARIRVALRRPEVAGEQPVVRTRDFVVDLERHRAELANGQAVHLTATEWQVVERLVRSPGKLFTQRQLLADIWGLQNTKSNLLRVYMVSIRRKLEPDPSHPKYFLTEPGVGIRFEEGGREDRAASQRDAGDGDVGGQASASPN